VKNVFSLGFHYANRKKFHTVYRKISVLYARNAQETSKCTNKTLNCFKKMSMYVFHLYKNLAFKPSVQHGCFYLLSHLFIMRIN
jgi:hypothetical protein